MHPSVRPAGRLASSTCKSSTSPAHHPATVAHSQVRHATLIRRPQRPYTFTQLIALSDGSTFTHRTTSPAPVYRSTRDTRNTPLWNPSNARMANVEEDEAGRLRAFRRRFGRAFDTAATGSPSTSAAAPPPAINDAARKAAADTAEGAAERRHEDSPPTEGAVAGAPAGPPAAAKTQEDGAPGGAGASATGAGGLGDAAEEDDGENLMDLLNQYADAKQNDASAAAKIVQRGTSGAGSGKGRGRKR